MEPFFQFIAAVREAFTQIQIQFENYRAYRRGEQLHLCEYREFPPLGVEKRKA